MLQAARPSFLCLQETKLDQIDNRIAVEFLGLRLANLSYLPAVNTCGGVLIAWDADYIAAASVVLKEFSMTMQITLKLTNASFLTTVYGLATDADKPRFLDQMLNYPPTPVSPWICLGDFNLIYESKG